MIYFVIGSGAVGSVIAKDLALEKDTKKVFIADINLESAKILANEIGSKAEAIKCDIFQPELLRELISEVDVVVNAVGPFYSTASHIIEACIDEEINYVDIADDSSAVIKLLDYDQQCKEAGIVALISQGVSPGTTNLLAMLGHEKLDETQEIHTNWVESIFGEIGPACIWHLLEMATGTCPQLIDGQMLDVPSTSGTEYVTFAEPLGKYPVYFVGHGEPVTLSRRIPEAHTITNRGNSWPGESGFKDYTVFEQIGLASTDTLNVQGEEIVRRDIAAALIMDLMSESADAELPHEDVKFQVHVSVEGVKNNKHTRYDYLLPTDMNPATGLSASYGAQVIAREDFQPGLYAPEDILNLKKYFAHLINEKNFQFTEIKTVEGVEEYKQYLTF